MTSMLLAMPCILMCAALMVAMPLVMAKALSHHNNAVRKAAWVHFGNTVCQEGDSYTIAFKEAIDAVAFCLQVRDRAMGVPSYWCCCGGSTDATCSPLAVDVYTAATD